MDYVIELLFFIVPLLTASVQVKVIGFLIDLLGWRKGCWPVGGVCIKKGNVIAFLIAFLVAVLSSAVDFIATGEPFTPTQMTMSLGLTWWWTQKIYKDNKRLMAELEGGSSADRIAELWDESES